MTEELTPDVILMDVRLPGMDGVSACREIKSKGSSSKVLMLSTYDDDKDVFEAIDAGASGFIIKDTTSRDLVEAIKVVARGKSFFHPIVSQKIADKMRGFSSREKSRLRLMSSLTHREIEVLAFISRGASNADIAKELFISEGTVKSHVSNILRKLGKHDRTQLALYAVEKGFN